MHAAEKVLIKHDLYAAWLIWCLWRDQKRRYLTEAESKIVQLVRFIDWPEKPGPTFAERLAKIRELLKIVEKDNLACGRKL